MSFHTQDRILVIKMISHLNLAKINAITRCMTKQRTADDVMVGTDSRLPAARLTITAFPSLQFCAAICTTASAATAAIASLTSFVVRVYDAGRKRVGKKTTSECVVRTRVRTCSHAITELQVVGDGFGGRQRDVLMTAS